MLQNNFDRIYSFNYEILIIQVTGKLELCAIKYESFNVSVFSYIARTSIPISGLEKNLDWIWGKFYVPILRERMHPLAWNFAWPLQHTSTFKKFTMMQITSIWRTGKNKLNCYWSQSRWFALLTNLAVLVPKTIPPVYIWKEFGGVDHLCNFQVTEFRKNRNMGASIYQNFKVGSCILLLNLFFL